MRQVLDFNTNVFEQFFQPLSQEFEGLKSTRKCGQLSDWDWIVGGVMRVVSEQKTGRGFLQSLEASGRKHPQLSHYFETLKSSRRLQLCQEVSKKVALAMTRQRADALESFPCLKGYEVYAGDGHFHKAACHDARKGTKEIKYATGHLLTLNLRTHALNHLKVGDVLAKKEHDMKGLKSLSAEDLRHQAPKGTKVLIIWDRAGIDFRHWYQWKRSAGVYFISRQKDNMKPIKLGPRIYEVNDPLNIGVLSDEYIGVSAGVMMRRVKYQDGLSGEEYAFITSDMELPPGMIAHLYRMRWDIEKVFDEVKSKFEEKKSWASTETAKAMQFQFICLAHNLMLLMDDHL